MEQFVVKYSEAVDLYMLHPEGQTFQECVWGSPDNPRLITWDTLDEAEAVATGINSGTVGTTKPA